MRVFDFWVRHSATLKEGDVEQDVVCYGGSDLSEADARRDAERRLDAVRARLRSQPDPAGDYEADIREEILDRIDAANVITRNRYGAEVLNSVDHLIVDIDRPRYRFWELWFGLPSLAKRKARIIADLKKRMDHEEFRGLGIRVYETHQGIRAIITGRRFDPRAVQTTKLMRSLNSDELYTVLCRKQGCYRARLTPKPYRMKLRAHRVRFPRDQDQEIAFQAWLPGYSAASADFDSCHLVCTLGVPTSSPVIRYHDERCGALGSLPLA